MFAYVFHGVMDFLKWLTPLSPSSSIYTRTFTVFINFCMFYTCIYFRISVMAIFMAAAESFPQQDGLTFLLLPYILVYPGNL